MKTLREFITEAWTTKTDDLGHVKIHNHRSERDIDGQRVSIRATEIEGHPEHVVDYRVNGEMDRRKNHHIKPGTRTKIGLHVAREVGAYVKEKKPGSLKFTGEGGTKRERSQKDKWYSRLAARAGGTVSSEDSLLKGRRVHRVQFEEGFFSSRPRPRGNQTFHGSSSIPELPTHNLSRRIAGHDVGISIYPTDHKPGAVEFAFDVDSKFSADSSMDKSVRKQIAQFIESSLRDYITSYKPLSVEFFVAESNREKKKQKLDWYKNILRSVGGKFPRWSSNPSDDFVAHFPKHHSRWASAGYTIRDKSPDGQYRAHMREGFLSSIGKIARRAKNQVGNRLPDPIRQRLAAGAMYGSSIRVRQDGDERLANKMRDEAGKLAMGRGRIPPPSFKNSLKY